MVAQHMFQIVQMSDAKENTQLWCQTNHPDLKLLKLSGFVCAYLLELPTGMPLKLAKLGRAVGAGPCLGPIDGCWLADVPSEECPPGKSGCALPLMAEEEKTPLWAEDPGEAAGRCTGGKDDGADAMPAPEGLRAPGNRPPAERPAGLNAELDCCGSAVLALR